MRTCQACGNGNPDDAAFCTACGGTLSAAPQQPAYTPDQNALTTQPGYYQPQAGEQAGYPEPQKKSPAKAIIIVVVALLLVCCCATTVSVAIWAPWKKGPAEKGGGTTITPPEQPPSEPGFETPELAALSTSPNDWVAVEKDGADGDERTFMVGPPNSEPAGEVTVIKGEDGRWRILSTVQDVPLDGADTGTDAGTGSEYPRSGEAFTMNQQDSYWTSVPFSKGKRPPPPNKSRPSAMPESAAWDSVDSMLEMVQSGDAGTATMYVTEDFFKTWAFQLFTDEVVSFMKSYSVDGWKQVDGDTVQIWATTRDDPKKVTPAGSLQFLLTVDVGPDGGLVTAGKVWAK